MKKDDAKRDLDKLNTVEAIEQTFLSWVQTGLTLIGVGFGVGSILAVMKVRNYDKTMIQAMKIVGLLLIFVGFISIVLSLVQHRKKLKELKNEKHHYKYLPNLPLFIGILIASLGIVAFIVILIHLIY